MSRYNELTDYLFSLKSSKRKTDLTHIKKIAEKLGHPERKFPSVHIAGTNGKGSVAFKMGEALKENGYRVGLFTSPHLFTYRERIQISGKKIMEERVVQGLEKIFSLTEDLTFFEVTTLLAFDYFAEEEVDIAIVEVGLGGRLDPTNILLPILTIITQIEMDHAPILGDTLEEIAMEKGGIIKEGIPLVLGEQTTTEPILKIAKEKNAPVFFSKGDSLSIVRKGLKTLPFCLERVEGIKKHPPCRYEKKGDVIFDVAHNPAALTFLFKTIQKDYPHKKIHVLFGMSKGKDIERSLEVIQKYADHIGVFKTNHPRLLPAESFSIGTPMSEKEALASAKKENALLVVTGSFYIMQNLSLLQESSRSL